ncbi:MAG: hypothetical protein LUG98_11740 [Tannerellaceae bacterium]|nr:hypothetical protein [Tannerellaceae bacterium]
MNKKDISQILEAFYNGEASPEEENELKAFFQDTTLPGEWQQEKEIFERYLRATEILLPEGLEERLEQKLSEHIAGKQRSFRYYLIRVAGVAAAVLLGAGIFFHTLLPAESVTADTFDDPVEAAIVAEQTLIFLSEQLNLGLNQVKEAQGEIHKINNIVYQQLKD